MIAFVDLLDMAEACMVMKFISLEFYVIVFLSRESIDNVKLF